MLEKHPAEGEALPIKGSVMMGVGTREEVVERLKKDVYYTAGVWDWEKVRVAEFFKLSSSQSLEAR